MAETCTVVSLPPEVLENIFKMLSPDDLCSVRFVCAEWHKVATADLIMDKECLTIDGEGDGNTYSFSAALNRTRLQQNYTSVRSSLQPHPEWSTLVRNLHVSHVRQFQIMDDDVDGDFWNQFGGGLKRLVFTGCHILPTDLFYILSTATALSELTICRDTRDYYMWDSPNLQRAHIGVLELVTREQVRLVKQLTILRTLEDRLSHGKIVMPNLRLLSLSHHFVLSLTSIQTPQLTSLTLRHFLIGSDSTIDTQRLLNPNIPMITYEYLTQLLETNRTLKSLHLQFRVVLITCGLSRRILAALRNVLETCHRENLNDLHLVKDGGFLFSMSTDDAREELTSFLESVSKLRALRSLSLGVVSAETGQFIKQFPLPSRIKLTVQITH